MFSLVLSLCCLLDRRVHLKGGREWRHRQGKLSERGHHVNHKNKNFACTLGEGLGMRLHCWYHAWCLVSVTVSVLYLIWTSLIVTCNRTNRPLAITPQDVNHLNEWTNKHRKVVLVARNLNRILLFWSLWRLKDLLLSACHLLSLKEPLAPLVWEVSQYMHTVT